MSALPQFTMRELLEAGVHYGHRTMRWNPKMAPFLFGSRNGTHIIDLQQTAPLLHQALKTVYEVVRKNGRVLFVGTKRQASEQIAEAAKRCGQYYVNHRWLGGMLTNWNTVSASIKTLRDIEAQLETQDEGLKKKERLSMQRKAEKLRLFLGGIMDMGGKPDLLFVIDTNKESIAISEARKLGIPVIAIVDSNSNPDGITYPIPGNDDATRAIRMYCKLVSDAALAGIQESLGAAGVDITNISDLSQLRSNTRNDNRNKAEVIPGKYDALDEEDEDQKKRAAKKGAKGAESSDRKPAKKPVKKEVISEKKPAAKKPAASK